MIRLAPLVQQFNSRHQWLVARMSMIGASDTPAILGAGYENQTAITVWHSKVNGAADANDVKRLKIGKLIEPSLRAIFTEETGIACYDPGDFSIYTHAEMHWLGATLDGLAVDEHGDIVPVELKNVGYFNRRQWDDEAPLKYEIQLQHQLAVTGADYGYLFALIGGNEPIVKKCQRNDRFIAAMIPKLIEFWRHVETKTLPPIDSSEATARTLAQIYPADDGETITLPPEAIEWARQLEAAKVAIRDFEKVETAAANKLKAAIGNATIGELPGGGRYSWTTQHRAAYEVKASSFRVLKKLKG